MKSKNKQIEHYLNIIDEIEKVRSGNNMNWMDILRLSFTKAPQRPSQWLSRENPSTGMAFEKM